MDVLLDVRLRLWAANATLDALVEVTFSNATEHGIEASQLVGEDYAPTQALAWRLRRDGAKGMIVPSAALPGTQNVVFFGPKVLFPYLHEPIDPEQVPTAHIADSSPADEVLSHVRHRGAEHVGLSTWEETGVAPTFIDPSVDRHEH